MICENKPRKHLNTRCIAVIGQLRDPICSSGTFPMHILFFRWSSGKEGVPESLCHLTVYMLMFQSSHYFLATCMHIFCIHFWFIDRLFPSLYYCEYICHKHSYSDIWHSVFNLLGFIYSRRSFGAYSTVILALFLYSPFCFS